jgi:hypothetical protein
MIFLLYFRALKKKYHLAPKGVHGVQRVFIDLHGLNRHQNFFDNALIVLTTMSAI